MVTDAQKKRIISYRLAQARNFVLRKQLLVRGMLTPVRPFVRHKSSLLFRGRRFSP